MSKAVSNYSSANGSGELISGMPDVITFYESYARNMEKYLSDTMSKLAPSYENYLRGQAVEKGWGEASKTISVSYDSDSMELSLTGDPYKEFGTGIEPPRPVIRSAIASVDSLERVINSQIEGRLF